MPSEHAKTRSVAAARLADFDEALWPIHLAVLILAGFVAAVIVAVGNFDEQRILYNGWTWLGGVGLTIVAAFCGIMFLQGKMLHRLQFCIIVSLTVHLLLAIHLHGQYLALMAERQTELKNCVTEEEQYEQIVVHDYHWQQLDQPEIRQSFEEPVEHEVPEPSKPEAIEHSTDEPDVPDQQQVAEEPETPNLQQPTPAMVEREELSAPHRAQPAGVQISRQAWRHSPSLNEPIPEPQFKPQPQQTTAVLEVRIAPSRGERLPVSVDQRQVYEKPSSIRQPTAVRLARRASRSEQLVDVPTTPSPTRQTIRAAEIPRTEAVTPEPVRIARRVRQIEIMANSPRRRSGGLPGEFVDRVPIDSAIEIGPASTTPGTVPGRRRLPAGDQPLHLLLAAQVGRGAPGRSDIPGMPRGISETGALQEEPVATAAATTTLGNAAEVVTVSGAGAEPGCQEGGLPVQIVAVAGPGGLGYDLSPEVGLPSRRARRASRLVHMVPRRFMIERSGGKLAIADQLVGRPTDAFRHRNLSDRAKIIQAHGGTEGTEKAVEMGLDFFARMQFPDGHWSLHELPPGVEYDDPALGQMQSDSAATALALLAYLGAGYTHLDDKHREIVDRGIDWLVEHQRPDGDLFSTSGGTGYTWLYSHGIAAMALCEAYGMTQDPKLREPARLAVEFIVNSQHPTYGGWRYKPGLETDTSVSGWPVMALKSAQMAGLDVPVDAFRKVGGWLDRASAPTRRGLYVYNPYAAATAQQRRGRSPSLAMTAEAMLMRMYLGRGGSDSGLTAGADYLKANLPTPGAKDRPARDCYYWYYATQAMFHMRGEYWTARNDRLRPLAEGRQGTKGWAAGSWHPGKPTVDRWGHAGGRHYVTAMHLLVLEVYYRYLPLFQELSR